MDRTLIQRYQPGGDIYAQLKAKYGDAGAALVAMAVLSTPALTLFNHAGGINRANVLSVVT
jgi:hypothetical protein